jgi:hypothetical protein
LWKGWWRGVSERGDGERCEERDERVKTEDKRGRRCES